MSGSTTVVGEGWTFLTSGGSRRSLGRMGLPTLVCRPAIGQRGHMATRDATRPRAVVCDLENFQELLVRPIRADDAPRLIAMHEGFSARTVHLRFLGSVRHLREPEAVRFATVDGRDRAALVAQNAHQALVAVARYDRLLGTNRAEVAVVVDDHYQHQGLGTAMLKLLISIAEAQGIEEFVAEVLANNHPIMATFRDAGLSIATRQHNGIASVVMQLPAHP